MNYDEWAEEYYETARLTEEKIQEYRKKMKNYRNARLLYVYHKRLSILYEMYDDCMYTADVLRRKADSLRKRGMLKLIIV